MDDRKLVLFGKSMGFDNLFNASDATLFAQSLRKYFLDNTPPSEFEDLAARKYHFSVPIYILPGLFDDVS